MVAEGKEKSYGGIEESLIGISLLKCGQNSDQQTTMKHPDDSNTGEPQGGAVMGPRCTAGKRGSLGSCGFQNRHSVLVCSGRCYKYHRLRDLHTIGNYFLEF